MKKNINLLKCTFTIVPLYKLLYNVLAKLMLDFSLFIKKCSL